VTQKKMLHKILNLVFSNVDQFTVKEVYKVAEPLLSFTYPKNNHIKDKIRQLLQDLQVDGILFNNTRGVWSWR